VLFASNEDYNGDCYMIDYLIKGVMCNAHLRIIFNYLII